MRESFLAEGAPSADSLKSDMLACSKNSKEASVAGME